MEQFTVERQEADLFEIFKRHEAAALDLNIGQLMQGKDAQGNFIEPGYTERTKQIKKARGQRYDVVTTRNEGDFHQGFFIEGSNFPARFNSTDWKSDFLTEKYGDLFGLDEQSSDDLREGYTNEDVAKYYTEQVFRLPDNSV